MGEFSEVGLSRSEAVLALIEIEFRSVTESSKQKAGPESGMCAVE